MNCWKLVYEVLKGTINPVAKPSIFMGQGSIMLELFRANSDRLFSKSELEQSSLSAIDNKPGDIILVMHTSSSRHEYLEHIAIAIDDGIYFEKAETGESVPIRIIDRQTLTQIWQPGVFDYEVRRLKPDAVLPHPQRVFSLSNK